MDDKRFVGVYHSESALLAKVEELKAQGIAEDNIYVVSKNDSDISMVRSRTSADIQTTEEESWLEKFMDFVTGKDHVHGMLHHLGLSEADVDRYYQDIENGGLLLYVDQGEASDYYAENEALFGMTDLGSDQNLGANAVNAYQNMEVRNQYQDSLPPDEQYVNDGEYGRVGGEAVLDRSPLVTDATYSPNGFSNEEERMKLREERLQVDKRQTETGQVSLEKDVVTEEQSVDVPVMREEVYVERRPVTDGDVADADFNLAQEDETIRIPVTEERLEVTKKPVVTEEIVVGKRQVEDVETVSDKVKREEAHLEQDGDVDITGDFYNKRNQNDPDY
ncbi:YsnF/AvaK domain-containing protein [Sporosarcina sp. Te-1]|uniref:YsnF/AvaK domain-containing protein n=1 Tax=Sporosarcina sp. Te-1 TaxID=2818390 RepID=UPI001A9FAA41|nr:YsnF/AvaK domain-containing protein [Sporosarcina sp. Te-1]QTD41033.1 YsnF/AvaK domain-containing protein [Sporosarcina sp. Te-1]